MAHFSVETVGSDFIRGAGVYDTLEQAMTRANRLSSPAYGMDGVRVWDNTTQALVYSTCADDADLIAA